MIMFWNQEEVFCGFSMQNFNRILDILRQSGIQYKYKIINYDGVRKFGTFGTNPEYCRMYYIYVHKKDAESAFEAIRRATAY